ncbi:MAG: hypothetical protein V7739_11075 [Motiliproteus sp.]
MTSAAVQEQYRQKYLAAMGITPWLPVRSLPGAACSAEWQWRAQDAEAAKPIVSGPSEGSIANSAVTNSVVSNSNGSVTSGTGSRARAATSAIQELLSEPLTAESGSRLPQPAADGHSTAAQTVASVQISTAAGSPVEALSQSKIASGDDAARAKEVVANEPHIGSVPRFRLAVIAFGDCLVVNELPLDVLQGMTALHQQLLERILMSVGLGSGSAHTQLLAWPVVNSSHVDQGVEVAQAGVANLLSRMQSSARIPLLLLGEQAWRFGLQQKPEYELISPIMLNNRPVLASVSLNQLMRVPGTKRELWHQLLKLKQLLSVES